MAESASQSSVGVQATAPESTDTDLGQLAAGNWQRAAAIIEKWPEWTKWLAWAWKHRGRLKHDSNTRSRPAPDEQQDEIVLEKDDVKILACLAEQQGRRIIQTEIAAATHICRGTVGSRLRRLRNAGLTYRPGTRGGDSITQAGLARLAISTTNADTD